MGVLSLLPLRRRSRAPGAAAERGPASAPAPRRPGRGGARRSFRGPPVLAVLALGALLTACGATRPPVPLRAEPVPWADTLPIEEPEARQPSEAARLFEDAVGDELVRPFSLRKLVGARHEALNVTRFDEVVPSAWFRPRNARRRLSTDAVRRGATRPDRAPRTEGVLTVVAGKAQGISPGFTVVDEKGDRYLFKFDPAGFLHMASGADLVSSRLFWAAGYNTPEDYLAVFDPSRLRLDPGAELTGPEGERPMEPEDVRRILDLTDRHPDGRYLALASRFVDGTPKGPFLFEGVREDDPNDHYRHQFRRELRGLYVMSAWVNHVDMRFQNTLDVYVEPGYLRHYLIDFAATLGSGTIRPHNRREGTEYNFDLWPTLARLATLGFWTSGWEGPNPEVIHPSVGWLPVEGYDPAGWKANWPNSAFEAVTARDGYWGAKLVGSFTDAQIRAAVEAGGLPDPAAADTLADVLIHRRDRTVAHWYGRVTPLEAPELERAGERAALTFRDLGLEQEVWTAGATRYRWSLRHPARNLSVRGEASAEPGPAQRIALPHDLVSAADDAERLEGERALAELEVTALRPGAAGRPAVVHLRWEGRERGYHVVGLVH